jgi:hypothetical protein
MTTDDLNMNKETVRKISVQNVGMRTLAVKLGGGTTGEISDVVHGLCGTISR